MPERSPNRTGHHTLLAGAAVAAAAAYALTWIALAARGVPPLWVAGLWVAETYAIVAVAYYALVWRPRHGRADRRGRRRIAAPVPIRYATEEGQVGVGALVDITEQGAGVLIPKGPFDALRVWMQLLWFGDYTGLQGRVIHATEVEEGLRVGLELDPLPPATRDLLTSFVVPYGGRRRARDPRRPAAAKTPLRVEHEGRTVWAIFEDRRPDGAVVLLPQSLPDGALVQVAPWGMDPPRAARVERTVEVGRPPVLLFRAELRDVPAVPSPAASRPGPRAGARVRHGETPARDAGRVASDLREPDPGNPEPRGHEPRQPVSSPR